MPMTKALGQVEDRKPREPAPLQCDPCRRVTMHTFSRAREIQTPDYHREIHDYYKFDICGDERRWG